LYNFVYLPAGLYTGETARLLRGMERKVLATRQETIQVFVSEPRCTGAPVMGRGFVDIKRAG
jgi:hypothetical protein